MEKEKQFNKIISGMDSWKAEFGQIREDSDEKLERIKQILVED